MNPFLKKYLGINLIVVAIVGILFISAGIYGVWRVRHTAIVVLDTVLSSVETTLNTTEAGLAVLDKSVKAATNTLDSTVQATEGIAQTVNEANTLLGNIADIASVFGIEMDAPDPQGDSVGEDIQAVNDNLNEMSSSLDEAQEVLNDYQRSVDDAQEQLTNIREHGPTWITMFAVILTSILLWLGVAQIGLLLQGWEMMQERETLPDGENAGERTES